MDAVKAFYEETYSADLMSVCITSNRSISELEKVAKKFKDIKNKKVVAPNMDGPSPFGPDEGRKVVKMTTNDDALEMRLVWCLPYYSDNIGKYNLKVFLQLFGHKGPKSIISHLKKEGLATSLEARKKPMVGITKFEIIIGLTEAGYNNYEKVAEAVFQYAVNLREAGPQENFVSEMSNLGKLQMFFPDRSTPLASSIKYAGKARKIKESDLSSIVIASYEREFDPALLQDIAEKFCDVNRVMVFLHSSEQLSNPLREKWTNTQFELVDNAAFWTSLENPSLGNKSINVPDVNSYTQAEAPNLNDLSASHCKKPVKLNVPNAWYLQDHKWHPHPKAIVQL